MQQVPDTDSSEFAALMDFIATSGRVRSHPSVSENADKLVSRMWSGRAKAMTQSITAMAKAAVRASN